MKFMNKPIKSYKAFDKKMCCRGFQYEVGKEYDMNGDIQCCKRGFHACESPMEVWNYYDMLTSRFAEVEQSGKISTKDGTTKVCSSQIKIKAELKLADIINIGVEWLEDLASRYRSNAEDAVLNDNGNRDAKIGSSDDRVQIGSSGDRVQIGSSGDHVQIGSSGKYTKIGSSGDDAKIGSSGFNAQIGSLGDEVQIGSSGFNAQIGSLGDDVQIGSSGDFAQISSSGKNAKIGSSGFNTNIDSSGFNAQISSSGFNAKIDSTGEDSVIMCAGPRSVVKAKIGSWITLAEWKQEYGKGRLVPVCVKTERVDGIKIKPDTWYKLQDGEFVEIKK